MRKFFSRVFVLASMLAVAACGGGGDSSFETPGTPGGGGGNTPAVSSVSVTSSSATILADGSTTADITAMVRDASNNLLSGVAVAFTASSGGVAVTQATTDATGVAKATLSTAGDSSIRTITVTATASGVAGTANVSVIAPPPPPTAATMTLITSSPTITSSGATTATVTAIVRNANNQFLADVPVQFSSTSGGLNVTQGTTDDSGTATAVLSAAGDPTNRPITVTATSGTVTRTVNVDVVGTTLVIQGPTSLASGQVATYTVILANSSAQGIPNQAVNIVSSAQNGLTASTITTNANGQATFGVTVTKTAQETLTASALGITTPLPVSVNTDAFKFTAPAAAPGARPELAINTPATLTVNLQSAGVPVAGQVVTFTSTRGAFTPGTGQATTDGAGNATVQVQSTNAGFGTITATAGSSTAQQPVEFVALTATSVEVQASAFTIGPSETATLTAVVRDSAGNLVKNKTVTFTLTDVSGGSLSAGTGVTDSNGRAQTIYTAGASTSAKDGVSILSSVQGSAATDTVNLTVARREVFISIGTGNSITEPNTAQYSIEYIVQVTDAGGNGVPNVPVTMTMLSERYFKGTRRTGVAGVSGWATCYTTVAAGDQPSGIIGTPPAFFCNTSTQVGAGCTDEDRNRNGVLDPAIGGNPKEDFNNSGMIEAGNIASVTPSNVVTDSKGFALVNVFYPQQYAYWVEATLGASTSVQGTEFTRESTFVLPGSIPDFTGTGTPPGPTSPFGQGLLCSNTD
jgi:hypothetical protein